MDWKYEANRIYLEDEAGKLLAEVTFPTDATGVLDIDRTFVDDTLRGQGMAGKLMEEAARYIRQQGKQARASCSYAVAWFPKHQEYTGILVAEAAQ